MGEQESNRIRRIIGWGIVGLVVVIGASIALSAFGGRGFFPFHFGWLGGIFLVLIIFWIARWVFWPWGRGWYRYEHMSAESILRERYARGEITHEQYQQMMQDLRKDD